MENTEDQTKPNISNLYDPLLSNYPTTSQTSSQTNLQYLQITYNHGPRQFKDLPFLILFVILSLGTFSLGIFASFNRKTSSCKSFSNPLLFSSSEHTLLIITLVVTFLLSFPFVLLTLYLLKNFAKQLVYICIPFFVLIPVFGNVYWFVACTVSSSCGGSFPLVYRILLVVFIFLFIGVIVWIIFINWHRIELTINIIRVAAHGLSENLGLFGVLPGLNLGLVVYYVPIVVFLVFANQNGKIVTTQKSGESYCEFKKDKWVSSYFVLAVLTMLWTAAAMVEAQAYVISGTISQWYFDKDGTGARRSIRNSLRNAFGPSFGTVCLSGLLFCVVRVVRAMVDSARRENSSGVVNLVLRCCVNAFVSTFDFLNKFTINFAAITGEAYCASAKMTYELLKRNLLSTVFVETISTRLLGGIVLVLSAFYAIVACVILNAVSSLGSKSYFVAGTAWVLLLIVLGYFVHVLDEVIETVYVCYAIDRDRGEVCKQEVHEVYVHLPISRNSRSPIIPSATYSSV